MRCEFYKGLLVKRASVNGDFYGCTSFPDCSFHKPCKVQGQLGLNLSSK
ncbi:MAG: topoisomerase DNA-binding C4 zinc finger domain-containing protein [Oscillospiraceae bacterium]